MFDTTTLGDQRKSDSDVGHCLKNNGKILGISQRVLSFFCRRSVAAR